MSVIRVAIVWPREPWRGAVNYYRNLCYAVSQLPNPKVKIVFFTGVNVDTYGIEDYVEVVHSPIFSRKTIAWVLWKIGVKLNRDVLLYRLLKKHSIDVVSHHPSLWEGCPISSVPWVPDFQFLKLPDMFRDEDIIPRFKDLKKLCSNEKHVILSSYDAKRNLEEFVKKNSDACPLIHVLQFASAPIELTNVSGKHELMEKYDLPSDWFYVPNQFWKHKNHKVIIDALGEIKRKRKDVYVVATGKTEDFRNPDYYQELNHRIDSLEVTQYFIALDEIPFKDVVSLMQHSVAVINPSLFEGWSTTVEESKALGKRIILSDIPVHREQNPRRGVYFAPKNAVELASILSDTIENYSTVSEQKELIKAQEMHTQSILKFSNSYENIIIDVTSNKEC